MAVFAVLPGSIAALDNAAWPLHNERRVMKITRSAIPVLMAAALFLAFSAGSAFAKFDPSFDWTTLETSHFLVHYHQGGEEVAQRAARVAEDVHRRLVPRIRWEPKEKTHLVLVDAMDEANGMSSPFPYNQMILFLTQPSGREGFGLTVVDDWLHLLITHEYTHILQLDMVASLPQGLQSVFGRLYFPNLFQPVWLIEGLATYEETEQTAGGRGRSPGSEMVLRMAAIENAFPPLDQMSVFPDAWPSGQVPYLFGESFTRFIADKFGREKLAGISETYSGRWFPFLVESTAERTLGLDYRPLWTEWKWSLKERYEKVSRALMAQGVTPSDALTRKGFVVTGPEFSPDGKRLAFSVVEGDEYPSIYVAAADGGGQRKLVENVFPSSASGSGLAWSPDGGRLFYTKIEVERNTNAYDDLYAFDVKSGRESRITRGLRARDPHLSPDGSTLVFVMNRMGMTRIALLNLGALEGRPAQEKDIVPVTPWTADQYETPRWSPDGKRIAAGIWQPGGRRDIRILDTAGRVIEEVTSDRAVDCGPAWSRDGTYLFFSSDRTGIFNIYAYEPAAKRVLQVTNVVGGAFAPSAAPDGRTLAFSSYSSRGYDIHTIALDPAAWRSAEPYYERYPVEAYDDQAVPTSTRPYSPLSTVTPRFWLPWFGYSEASGWMVGALTLGQDVIQRHQYLAQAYYGPKNGRIWYGFDYFYDGLYPTIHLHASDTDVTYGDFYSDRQGTQDYVERDKSLGASLIIPLLKFGSQHALTVGYQRKDVSHLSDVPPWPGYTGELPAEGVLASGRLAYLYNNSRRYVFSISPEDGRTVGAGVERFSKALGSDFDFTKYSLDWYEYFNLPWKHQVLLLHAFGGTSTGNPPPQGAFQLGGDNPGDITLTLDDQTVSLRGYPANILRGQKAAFASMEYRFPAVELEKGSGTTPFYYRRLHGAVFFEAGTAWNGGYPDPGSSDLRRSVGAEARLDMTFAFYLPLTIRFVIAKGLDQGGESQAYIGLWMPMGL
jgi:Tol biopolymer transport system component